MLILNIDFETRSKIDLIKAGEYRYAEDKSTKVLCVSWAIGDEEPRLWIDGQPPPHDIFKYIGKIPFSAFNAEFEITIWKEVCVKRMYWPEIPDGNWIDTATDARALGLPGNLEGCALALNVIHKKDPIGKKLIQKLCKPISSGKNKGHFREKDDFHEDYINLYNYCKQDVRVEREIRKVLPYKATEDKKERKFWLNTIKMNRRGLPIDVTTALSIQDMITDKRQLLDNQVMRITDGKLKSSRQREKLRLYLNENFSFDLQDMQNVTIENLLDQDIPQSARDLLQNRRDMNHPSVAKIKKAFTQLCLDNTVKGCYIHSGAGTGRYTASGFQPQNFPRLSTPFEKTAIEAINQLKLEDVELLFGDALHLFSSLLRAMIHAPHGYKFLNSDLSQIEARMTAWIAMEISILDAYKNGLDAYRVIAAEMYNVIYENVTGSQRQAGKTAVLACGFGGSVKALLGMAAKYGITFTEDEAIRIVDAFREARPKLVNSWYAFGDAAKEAILNPGYRINVKTNPTFAFKMEGNFLFLMMPNGRNIYFPFPEWRPWTTPWDEEKYQVTYMWMSTYTRKWERRSSTGASLFQSAVQGLSRDILMEAHARLEASGYPIMMTVHDELMSMVPDDNRYNKDHFSRVFVQNPEWCLDLPLACDTWEGYRYKK